MYRIDTGQARTDLYGINKGAAQVIDLSHLDRQNEINARNEEHKLAAKEAREGKLIDDISALDKGQIRPSDSIDFQNKQKAIYDLTKSKFAKGKLSIDDQIEIESAIGKLKQEALMSGARRTENDINSKLYLANPHKYRNGGFEAIQKDNYDISSAGNFNQPVPGLENRIDLNQFVNEKLAPEAERQAKMVNVHGRYSNTPAEREHLVRGMLADPENFKQATIDYEDAIDKLGAKTPTEYMNKLFDKQLTVDYTPPLSERDKYGDLNADKGKTRVTTNVNSDGSVDYHMTNPTTNEQIIVNTKDGKIQSGVQGGRLTPTEKAEREKAISYNNSVDKKFQEDLAKVKEEAMKIKIPATDYGNATETAIKKREKYVQDHLPLKPKHQIVPHQEKGKEVDATQAQQIAFDKYKVNVGTLINEGKQEGVDVQQAQKAASSNKPKLDY